MSKQEQFDALVTRLNAATAEIASDLSKLREEIKDTVSAESLATFDANVSKLEALGADPADPVPSDTGDGTGTDTGTGDTGTADGSTV